MPEPAQSPPADAPTTTPTTTATTRATTAVAFGLVLVLTVLLCVWGAFLVPLRVGTVRVPVSLLIAGVGNLLLGRAGGRLLGAAGVLVPGAVWLGLAVLLGSRRPEGDLIIPGDLVGTLFLAVGALGFAVAYGLSSAHREVRATPAAGARR